jgi:hypothetical protein
MRGGDLSLEETRKEGGATGQRETISIADPTKDEHAVTRLWARTALVSDIWTTESVAPGNIDWNTEIIKPGLSPYLLPANAAGGPQGGGTDYFFCLVISYAGATFLQIALPYISGPAADRGIFLRGRYGGINYPWGQLDILP